MGTDRSLYNLQKIQDNMDRGNIFLDSYPAQVHFLMIDKCNVKCIMCGGDYFKSKSGRRITLDKFQTMAANLKLENVRAVVLAGAGDPMLNQDLIPIVQFINRAYPQIAISITTNGLGLTESIARALIDCRVSQVNISINSASRSTYRRIMQIDGFDAVCRNARTFDDLRKQAGKPVSLQFSAAIHRLNIEEMPRLVELARETGADSINLFYTRFYPEPIRDLNIEDPADRLKNEDSLFYHQQLSDDRLEEAKTLAGRYGIRLTHEPLFKDQASPSVCTWAMMQLMVGFDGEVYPCGGSEVHFREKVEKGIYDFGNALTGAVDVFWNSEAYRALRISARQGETCLVPECKCCANVISPNDVRSHIMDWSQDGTEIFLPPPISTLPLVSVIVPTYNRPDQLVSAVRSILAQTYRKVEVIVVNDNGVDVADRLAPLNTENNIKYINHIRNSGLAAARNTGIRASRGKYIAYLDDDDLFYPDHLDTLVRFLEAGDHKVAYTDAYRAHQVNQNGAYVVFQRDVPYSFDFDYDRILETNFVPVLCFVHARSCLDAVGLFDESLKRLEDWDLWIRMSRKFRFAHIKKITCEFSWRVDGTSMSSAQDQEFAAARAQIAGKYGLDRPAVPRITGKVVPSLVSIVILTYNQLSYTKECVESIRRNTPEPHEIIFVDNGSTDGTVKWLKKLVGENRNCRLIENQQNLGFPKGCNQGIETSRGEFLVLLNNDVVVTRDWLAGMLETLQSVPDVGFVGPMTNNVIGRQKISGTGYDSLSGLPNYAAKFRSSNRYRRIESARVVGFCMLFRRTLAELIGLFDERFGIGNFEDDDLCLRAELAGFRNIIAGDVFVHHYGSKSFTGNKIDADVLFRCNHSIFVAKWDLDLRTPLGRSLAAVIARRQALESYHRGNLDAAIQGIVEGLTHDPDNSELYWLLADMLYQSGLYKDALETLASLPPDAHDNTRTLERLANAKSGLGAVEEAEALVGLILARSPGYAPALNLKGTLAYQRGDKDLAESLFKRAMAADPSYGEPATNLGVMKFAAGAQEDGLRLLERGFVLSPVIPDCAARYHAAIISLGHLDQAIRTFRDAQSLYSSCKQITFLLTDLLIRQESYPDAMREIEDAIIRFDAEEGLLAAALEIRGRLGPLAVTNRSITAASLSLCLISRDNESRIAENMMRLKAVAQEIIVVDTGSTDRTKDLARVFGAQVFDAPPGSSIIDAYNMSLTRASGDWILLLQANETIPQENIQPFMDIITKKPADPVAYRFTIRSYVTDLGLPGFVRNDGAYVEETGCGWVPSRAVRLFPLHSGITFDGPPPGNIESSIRRSQIQIKECSVPIHDFTRIGVGDGTSEGGLPPGLNDNNSAASAGCQHTTTCGANNEPCATRRSAQAALSAKRIQGLTSIVILTFNELKYTRECVESIEKNTPEPHEIIFVDNASKDGTLKWMKELARKKPNYQIIENKTNCGFAKGCNQGIEASSGEYILLLNNDVVVTKGWLSGLLECLESDPGFAVVGPMTNNISGIQKVDGIPYITMIEMEEFGETFREKYRHRRIPSRRIVGFCMLFRRSLVEKIGLLDERFGSGNFEDDDYCYRSALEGYTNIIAGDVFIHHYGSKSFIGNKIDYSGSLSGNKRLFNEKWSGIEASSQLGMKMLVLNAVERARELQAQGRLDKAVDVLVETVKQAPDAVEIYCCLAELFLEDHNYQEALDSLKAMPETIKPSEQVLTLMGYALEGSNLGEDAEKYADHVLTMHQHSATAMNLKGLIAHKRGDLAAAERFFREACEADPGYGEPFTNMGVMKWATGKKQEALSLLEKGFALSPAVPDLGRLYYAAATDCEKFATAEKLLRDAKMLHPNNKPISFLLIDSLLKQADYEKAMQEIEQAMIAFGIDDGILQAALDVRAKLGPKKLGTTTSKGPTLSLCLIVKDEEQHLAQCLNTIKAVIDEMIVVDIGSTDRTKDIARCLRCQGLRLFLDRQFCRGTKPLPRTGLGRLDPHPRCR